MSQVLDVNREDTVVQSRIEMLSNREKDWILDMLPRIPIFGGVAEKALQHILDHATSVSVPKGGYFFRETERTQSMFVLVRGRVELVKTSEWHEYELGRMEPGACFGELELIDFCPRAAAVRALEDCSAIEIPVTLLHEVFTIDPTSYAMLQMNMGREVSRRLRELDEDLPERLSTAVTIGGYSRWTMVFYAVGGALLGYGILHPLTMVIYMFEFSPPSGASDQAILAAVFARMAHAFHHSMGMMGGYFILQGTGLGVFAGLCARALSKQGVLIARHDKALGRDLVALIQFGENETTEFKASLRWDFKLGKVNKALEHAVAKTIAAFMNCSGGTLLVGVDDNGRPMGIAADLATLKHKNEDGFEQRVTHLVSTRFGTHFCSLMHIVFHTYDDKRICRIHVEAAPEPVYMRDSTDRIFFIRTGNSTRELNIEEAIHYISDRWTKFRNRTT